MTVFDYHDYKKYLEALIDSQRIHRGYQTKLADAAGCQKAFISQVLHGSVHLTFDHALGLCQFWKFNDEETQYFVELVQFARAGTPTLRHYAQKRVETIRQKHSELSSKFKSTSKIKDEFQTLFYSTPLYSAIHVLTSIPAFQKEAALAQRLKISSHEVLKVLVDLERMELVQRKKDNRWVPTERNIFLPRQSPLAYMHHFNCRIKALLDVQAGTIDSIHYSTLHALSMKDIETLRHLVLEFLKQTKAVVDPSPEEEMIYICLDFFKA